MIRVQTSRTADVEVGITRGFVGDKNRSYGAGVRIEVEHAESYRFSVELSRAPSMTVETEH